VGVGPIIINGFGLDALILFLMSCVDIEMGRLIEHRIFVVGRCQSDVNSVITLLNVGAPGVVDAVIVAVGRSATTVVAIISTLVGSGQLQQSDPPIRSASCTPSPRVTKIVIDDTATDP
jgi:hypothetical protein